MTVRTRFAPSPTGFLHIGGLRTALFSYLFARKNKGTFILRVEDTDQERLVEGGIENIIKSLQWAGITVDEGVTLEKNEIVTQIGEYGPYVQSERLEIYKKHINQLIVGGHAYYCYCTKERLDEVRKFQELNKLPTGYDGHCRTLSLEENERLEKNIKSRVVRMKMPKEGTTVFSDMIRGEISFENHLIDDQVILKSDGFPTYHLAAVVDDHLMNITHVIRGEEWLSSTPKHIVLYRMFGWKIPEFAHLSLIINEQKQKLSKRHGDVSVEDFKEKGYVPEALVNFVAFLGWNPGDNREVFTLEELEKEFSFDSVSKAAAVFNREKLDWYNKHFLMSMDDSELAKRAQPFFAQNGIPESSSGDEIKIQKILNLERGRASTLNELVQSVRFMFADSPDYEPDLLVWKKSTREDTKKYLSETINVLSHIEDAEWNAGEINSRLQKWITEAGCGIGDIYWPLRVALSGQKNSPGPTEIADSLGKQKTIERLKHAVSLL